MSSDHDSVDIGRSRLLAAEATAFAGFWDREPVELSGRPLLHWLQSMPFAYCRQRLFGLLRGATVVRTIPTAETYDFVGECLQSP